MSNKNNVRIIVEFKDSDCERFTTDKFSIESGVVTIKQDGEVKRTLRLDYIRAITIY